MLNTLMLQLLCCIFLFFDSIPNLERKSLANGFSSGGLVLVRVISAFDARVNMCTGVDDRDLSELLGDSQFLSHRSGVINDDDVVLF